MTNREFDGFNDPVAKILLGIGAALTLMLYAAAYLKSVEMLKSAMWFLGAYAVFGASYGLARSSSRLNSKRR